MRLETLEQIDYNYLHDLVGLTSRLIEVVARDSENIKREVALMGGGKVLEMESEKIHNSGIAQGIAMSVVMVLSRFGTVSDELKSRVMEEKDEKVIKTWLQLAATVSSISEFEEKM